MHPDITLHHATHRIEGPLLFVRREANVGLN